MRLVTIEDFDSFLAEKTVAVIHFDAEWNLKHRRTTRREMKRAATLLGDLVSVAEVDIDDQPDLAKEIPIVNIPTVTYFQAGKLVAALVGANQNVVARAKRVLAGKSIGRLDDTA